MECVTAVAAINGSIFVDALEVYLDLNFHLIFITKNTAFDKDLLTLSIVTSLESSHNIIIEI